LLHVRTGIVPIGTGQTGRKHEMLPLHLL
jgi:hypothetical protein